MYHQYFSITAVLLCVSIFTGCATKPEFDTSKADLSLTPASVIADPDRYFGKIVVWGGTILDTHNLKDMTQLEVLAFPLDSYYRPLQSHKPFGRFIIQHKGYLEPATFTQGRLLSVLGSVSGSQIGNVGESTYTYPVIKTEQLHLWSSSDELDNTSFHFGIGLRL